MKARTLKFALLLPLAIAASAFAVTTADNASKAPLPKPAAQASGTKAASAPAAAKPAQPAPNGEARPDTAQTAKAKP